MLDTPIEKFVSYYQIDEMSESDENDFEEDGQTMRSSPRALPQDEQIFNRDVDDASMDIASDDYGEDIKLNESLEERVPGNQTMQSSQILRLRALPGASLSPTNSRPSSYLQRH